MAALFIAKHVKWLVRAIVHQCRSIHERTSDQLCQRVSIGRVLNQFLSLQAEPYEAYRDKQFKFMNIANRDFSTACQAPKYKDD